MLFEIRRVISFGTEGMLSSVFLLLGLGQALRFRHPRCQAQGQALRYRHPRCQAQGQALRFRHPRCQPQGEASQGIEKRQANLTP